MKSRALRLRLEMNTCTDSIRSRNEKAVSIYIFFETFHPRSWKFLGRVLDPIEASQVLEPIKAAQVLDPVEAVHRFWTSPRPII